MILLRIIQGVPELQVAIRKRGGPRLFVGVNVEARRHASMNDLVKLLKVVLHRELGGKLDRKSVV